MKIAAFIFDLDGVIVDTAKFHYLAWKRMAQAIGTDLSEEQNEELKGVSRKESLEAILNWGGIEMSDEDKQHWMAQKNDWYLEYVEEMSPDDLLPGVLDFLENTRLLGLKIALGSASKNARKILIGLDILSRFDTVVDGTRTVRSKPDPEVFLTGASDLVLQPMQCVVFEDALRGVEAAVNGGFHAIGIGDPDVLDQADFVIPGLHAATPQQIIDRLTRTQI